MNLEDQYKMLVEAYYGVVLIDEYELKEYILKDIEKLIENFEEEYQEINHKKIKEYVKENVNDKTKLESSLIILNSMNAPMDLILLIKNRLQIIRKRDMK